jgi:tetratricopeptide (TPR) repeat protein
MYREALNRNKTAENTLAVGLTHDGAAIFAMHMSSPLIMEHVEKSIPIFRAHQDHVRLAMALTRKAWGVMLLGNEDEAIMVYQEAIGIGRQLMDKRPVSAALNNLAGLYCMREEFAKAGPCFEEALAIDREREDSTGIILGLVNISRNTLEQDKQLVGVRSKLAEAAKIAMEAHLREYFQFIIETSSLVRFSLGDHLQGARLFCAALAELKIKGNQLDPTDIKHFEHWTAKIRETLGETAFAEALEAGGRLSYEEAMAETRKWLEEDE